MHATSIFAFANLLLDYSIRLATPRGLLLLEGIMEHDPEKAQAYNGVTQTSDSKLAPFIDVDVNSQRSSENVVEYNSTPVKQDNGILSKMRRVEAAMDKKLGIESQAIDRKLPETRQPVSWHSQLTMFFLWASGTMNLSCFATGFLGYEFGIRLGQTIPLIIFGSILGASITGFCATLGGEL